MEMIGIIIIIKVAHVLTLIFQQLICYSRLFFFKVECNIK